MTKELATQNESLPSFINQFQAVGAEDLDTSLLKTPFLKIAHNADGDLKAGEFYDGSTNEPFGKEVVVTVCKIVRIWKKFIDGSPVVSYDGKTWDDGQALTEDEKWQTKNIDMYFYMNGKDMSIPLIFTFKSTSFKYGKDMASMITKFVIGNKEPIFSRNFTIYGVENENKMKKKFQVVNFKLNQGFNDEETMIKCNAIRSALDNVQLIFDEPSEEVELD